MPELPLLSTMCVLLCVLVLSSREALASDPSQAANSTWVAPPRAARQANPFAGDAAAVERGKALYAGACSPCHGATGKGDGPAGAVLQRGGRAVRPRNLTDPALWQESDGALFWKISEGRTPMPSFHETLSTDQRWELVCFIRTLAANPASSGGG